MANMIIAFQLNGERSYNGFFASLALLGDACQVTDNVWFVSTVYSVTQCREFLRDRLDYNTDTLAVFNCSKNFFALHNTPNNNDIELLWERNQPEPSKSTPLFDIDNLFADQPPR